MLERQSREPIFIDDNGVDRTQIRQMLALTPIERLRWLEQMWASICELRQLYDNDKTR